MPVLAYWLIGGTAAAGIGTLFLSELNQSARYALVGAGGFLAYKILK